MGSAAPTKTYDVLIIGAGPAGLSAALGLARQCYSALVFDSSKYRNAPADHIHNIITWDHRNPADFRAAGRANILSRYPSISFRDAEVTSAAKLDDGSFELTDASQETYRGKVLMLASGVTDVMLPIPGYTELWGKSIFHCLFCHGFEEKGATNAGVLAAGLINQPSMILHMARMATNLVKDVTVYCDGDQEVATTMQEAFKGKPLTIEGKKIVKLEKGATDEDVTVHLEGGEVRKERFLVSVPTTMNNGSFVKDLNLETEPFGFIKVTPPFNETSVPGVFAIGDCATMMKAAPNAINMGSFGAAGAVAKLASMGKL
ncbi:related to thioredoxin reductase [Ramularia collo-cygni]|uniref:Related to thioredoxin reductase n=1 Tax=Ramularia collo-cygni TaxID=112498 RepID=A0A2D3UZ56_9PEZI|nr:related to thioredoxin reductase [Ramularia collo-cygni]CZT16506.1 related to thioredoxin reductase [Ramularia collo-cygni]